MKQIGHYEVLSEIGRGGMGVVFQARDPAAGRAVAIKLMLAAGLSKPASRKRFEREAEALGRVSHPNVVRLERFDVTDRAQPYLVMEWVEGESLQARLERAGALDPDDAVELVSTLCEAVSACHLAGVLHRDLKPENVLVDREGVVKLTDFGLVRDVDPSLSRTQLSVDGKLLGSPGYWAPEQARGELRAISERTDVYGLGATLFALLTGRPPHDGVDLVSIMTAVVERKPAPSSLEPAVPRWLDAVVARALATDPQDRFADPAQLGAALAAGRSDRASGPPRAWQIALAVIVAGATVAALLLVRTDRSRPQASPSPELTAASSELDDGTERTALMRRALAHREAGRNEAAVAAFTEVIQLDPEFAAAFVNRGAAKAALGDHDGAKRDYDDAVALDPEFPLTYNNRGSLLQRSGDLHGALGEYERALRLEPKFVLALANRGSVRQELGDFEGAIADCDRALELDPRCVLALVTRGAARSQTGDATGGLEDLNGALGLDPGSVFAYLNRGAARSDLGDREGALEDLSEAIRLDPARPTAYRNRGFVHGAVGDYPAAIADYTEALRLEPDRPETLQNLGIVRLHMGQTAAAAADFRRALELKTDLYLALWYAAASGDASPLEEFARGEDWGSQLARHALGRLTQEDLLNRALTGEARQGQLCEALGYLGLERDLAGDRVGARPHYEACVETGVTGFVEYVWAKARLQQWRSGGEDD